MTTEGKRNLYQRVAGGLSGVGRAFTSFRRTVMWAALVRQKWWFLALLFVVIASTALAAFTLSALQRFFDDAILRKNPETVIPVGQAVSRLVVLALLSALAGMASKLLFARIRFHLEYEMRGLFYRSLQSQDPRALDNVASGQVVTRALTDLQLLLLFIAILPGFVLGLVPFIGFTIYLAIQDVPLTILALSTWFVNGYLVNRMRHRTWGLSFLQLNRFANVTTRFDESVRGIRVVKAFGREDDERRRLAEAAGEAYGASMARQRLVAKFDILLKGTPLAISMLLILLGARWVMWGWLSVGTFIVFIRIARGFAQAAGGLDEIISGYYFAKTGAGRMLELMGTLGGGILPPPATGDPLPEPSRGLELQRVSVALDGVQVVSGVDAHVPYGSLVVVAGPPGSGRSTVANLTTSAVSPTSGRVLLDGADVSTLHPTELRRAVRIVAEDEFLFARSVRENLQMGGEAPGMRVADAALNAALHAAAADEIVEELPQGLETVIGDRGLTLSGGQRQRLALARALVSPPRLLVLDDALMSVHPALEVEILRRIRTHAPDTAVLCLTRRDAAQSVADRVLRLPAAPPGRPAPVRAEAPKHDAPYDPRLLDIINVKLPPDTERPEVNEAACRESDRPPGVRSALSPVKKAVLIATLLLLFFTLGNTLVPSFLFGRAVDALEAKRFSTSDLMAIALFAFGGTWAIMAYFLSIFRRRVEESIMYILRRRVFQRITRLGIDFYDRELPGQMATRAAEDVRRVGRFVDNAVYRTATAILTLVAVFTAMTIWSPSVGLTGMAFAPILILISIANVPIARRLFEWSRRELGGVIERLQEDFNGRRVLYGFGARTSSLEAFMERAKQLKVAQLWAALLTSSYTELIELIIRLAGAAILWRAGNLAVGQALTVGAVTTLSLYLNEALEPIPRLANVLEEYMEARASIRKLREPFEAPIRPPEDDDAPACPPLEGGIDFDGVSFVYPGTDRVVLDDINLHLASGRMVALVGPTGAGKSSVAKLLGRIYDPDEGSVSVDGVDVRDYAYASYRQRFGIVPQETFCFRGTVAGNIGYAKPGATPEEMQAAIAAVGGTDAIASIKGGLSGTVEEDGRNLTAAQKQLIALSRAVLAGPDILILDEATATLDANLEQRVLNSLRKLGKTMVVVTHRLPVAKHADLVCVIDGGRIAESGTHSALLRAGGPYARLWAYGTEVDDKALRGRRPAKPRTRTRAGAKSVKAAPAKAVRAKPSAVKAVKANDSKVRSNGAKGRGTVKTAAGSASVPRVVKTKAPRNGRVADGARIKARATRSGRKA